MSMANAEISVSQHLEVHNPATAEVWGLVPLSPASEVDQAAQPPRRPSLNGGACRLPSASSTFLRAQGSAGGALRGAFTQCHHRNGKVLMMPRGEMRRAIENVEVACGIPIMMLGDFSEDIARGIDEYMIRQPVGVDSNHRPFNFPGMIPFWFLPYALACRQYRHRPNRQSGRPMTMQKVFKLNRASRLPAWEW